MGNAFTIVNKNDKLIVHSYYFDIRKGWRYPCN